MSHIPVISLNTNGMERNDGFVLSPKLLVDAARALVYGDLMMRCLYRVRPYEKVPGSANALHEKWRDHCIEVLMNNHITKLYQITCQQLVHNFTFFRWMNPFESLVKYMPLANNHLMVELITSCIPNIICI